MVAVVGKKSTFPFLTRDRASSWMSGPSVFRRKHEKTAAPVNEKHSDVATVEVPGTGLAMRAGGVRADSPVRDGDVSAVELTDRTKQLICGLSPSRLPHSQCLQCC